MVKSLIAVLILFLAAPVVSGMPFDSAGLTECGTDVGMTALSGARFTSRDGVTIKLALIKAPELWSQKADYKSWPHATDAQQALQTAIAGQALTFYCEGQHENRYGDLVAHVVVGETWLQHQMVKQGHLLVMPAPGRKRGLEALFAAEDMARAERTGLWAYDTYHPVDALSKDLRPGWFQIVRGTVLKAEHVGRTVYLNFEENWRSDFTVEIPQTLISKFEQRGLPPLSLAGKTIEVRGWVDWKAGPRILLGGPGPVRLLETAAAAP